MTQENRAIQPRPPKAIASLSEENIAALLEIQKKELELRAQELEQRRLEDQHSFEFAQRTLEAKKEDRHEARINFGERVKIRYKFIIVVLVIVLLFFGYALRIGEGELVGRVLEKISYYVAGILSSYGYLKFKDQSNDK